MLHTHNTPASYRTIVLCTKTNTDRSRRQCLLIRPNKSIRWSQRPPNLFLFASSKCVLCARYVYLCVLCVQEVASFCLSSFKGTQTKRDSEVNLSDISAGWRRDARSCTLLCTFEDKVQGIRGCANKHTHTQMMMYIVFRSLVVYCLTTNETLTDVRTLVLLCSVDEPFQNQTNPPSRPSLRCMCSGYMPARCSCLSEFVFN